MRKLIYPVWLRYSLSVFLKNFLTGLSSRLLFRVHIFIFCTLVSWCFILVEQPVILLGPSPNCQTFCHKKLTSMVPYPISTLVTAFLGHVLIPSVRIAHIILFLMLFFRAILVEPFEVEMHDFVAFAGRHRDLLGTLRGRSVLWQHKRLTGV